jgi:CheY-like chemotaxis protein
MAEDAPGLDNSLAGLKILVVDDQFLIASLAEDTLLQAGAAAVVIATNHAEAHSALGAHSRFDAAVIDINLDGRPGFDLALVLVGRGVPLVFLTGYGEDAQVPPELRNIAVVAKPYTPDLLVTPLLEAIRRGSAKA